VSGIERDALWFSVHNALHAIDRRGGSIDRVVELIFAREADLRAKLAAAEADVARLKDALFGYFLSGVEPDGRHYEAIADMLVEMYGAEASCSCERGLRWRAAIDAAKEKR